MLRGISVRRTYSALPLPDVTCGPPSCWVIHLLLGLTRTSQASLATPEDHLGGYDHIRLSGKVVRFFGHRGKELCGGDSDDEIGIIL